VLLTGGKRSINKVVGLGFEEAHAAPVEVVKFARVPESEPGLAHEAEVLRQLDEERPGLDGVPEVKEMGRRAGCLAVRETPVSGVPAMSELTPSSFPRLASELTEWLTALAGEGGPAPRSEWWTQLIEEPLERFERQFGSLVAAGDLRAARARLERLGPLPIVFEHRDCAPWNVVLSAGGKPARLDWESAEPRGLPALDLVYFLANAAFVLDGALEAGSTRQSYAQLLDPATPAGRVAADCFERYCGALRLDLASLPALRLLTWIVHSRSDVRHAELDTGGPPSAESLRAAVFLGLAQEELRCASG
jgi:hypothetical protein